MTAGSAVTLPDDILAHHIFSWFNSSTVFSIFSLVCKDWFHATLLYKDPETCFLDAESKQLESMFKFFRSGRSLSLTEMAVEGAPEHGNETTKIYRQLFQIRFESLRKLLLTYYPSNQVGWESAGDFLLDDCKELCMQTDHFENLETLHVKSHKIGDEGCNMLASAGFRNLSRLFLTKANIGDVGCQYLSDIPNLRTLCLYSNRVTSVGVEYLSKGKSAAQLQHLYLSENNIGDEGCKFIALFKNLEKLTLLKNGIGDEGVKVLSEANLEKLSLLSVNDQCTNISCSYIGNFKSLTDLNLNYCKGVNDDGLKSLTVLSKLRSLRLNFTGITDDGVKIIASSFKHLERLHLDENQLTKEICEVIASNAHNLPHLKYMSLECINISSFATLFKAFPGLVMRRPPRRIYSWSFYRPKE